ncbi:MAG TPA: hypothetical protein VM535_02290, partial [Candidatus Saccharimonadales bacterium]|nr:hypothetical protein [Candidatus Saccharimonadales bacterium]
MNKETDMEASIAEWAPETELEEIVANAASFVTRLEAVVINPVPYAGNEQSSVHHYQPFMDGDFWIN